MAEYSVNTQRAAYIAGEMHTISTQIKLEIENLETQAQASLQQWVGSARDAYYVQKVKWDQAAENMGNLASTGSTTLDDITQSYDAGERAGQGLWG
ncbi:WXG100 family type VII secretion target [Streptomyces griseoluteus]|uniref:WXG100 family type VII secretion target n=1 Tax=Streptomyces griseoluteus TaxID=29306 RepID=UPI0037FAB27E